MAGTTSSETTTTPSTISKKSSPNIREVAGGTAANIFVVCCCCPCGLAECLIMSVYKLPVSIIRRMWRKRRNKKLTAKRSSKKAFLDQGRNSTNGVEENGINRSRNDNNNDNGGLGFYSDEMSDVDNMKDFEKMKKVTIDGSETELDRQMWDQFNDTGFWRTCSQRHT